MYDLNVVDIYIHVGSAPSAALSIFRSDRSQSEKTKNRKMIKYRCE